MSTPTTRSKKQSPYTAQTSPITANPSKLSRLSGARKHSLTNRQARKRYQVRRVVARWSCLLFASLIVVLLVVWLTRTIAVSSSSNSASSEKSASSGGQSQSTEPLTIMTINGDTIDEREFLMEMQFYQSNVLSYFAQKYGATDSAQFWTTPFGSAGTPLSYLKIQVKQQIISITIQQELARKYGLIKDISYSSFLNNLKAEDEQRLVAQANHQIIYGPLQYDAPTYFQYLLSNLVQQLQQQIKWPDPSQQDLYQLYLSVRDQQFLCTMNDNTHVQASDCTSDHRYQTFSSVQNTLIQIINDQRYNTLITQLVRQAKVQINEVVYASLMIN